MKAVVVVPMLGRPHTIQPLVASLESSTPKEAFRLLFVCSASDKGTADACRATGHDLLIHGEPVGPGNYAAKINAGYRASAEPLLFTGACDIRFHPGWLEAATAKLTPGIGVVGTQDLGNPRVKVGMHSTHSLVTRDYADLGQIDGTPGLLHEGYRHEYVDDELVGTAKKRNAWAFAPDSVVEHLHPHWSKAPMDDLYAAQMERMRGDRHYFRQRASLWT